ncbi:hypothetical protein Tco_0174615 [Tanacetum coccineum]
MKTLSVQDYLASSIKPTRTSRNSESYKEYYAIAFKELYLQDKEVRRKLIQIQPLNRSLPLPPIEKEKKKLKAFRRQLLELRQTNQYAEALSFIPGIVDPYLANKMREAVDVAVQLKYDRIREESNTANQ